jgi:hypothetical protein
MNEAAMRKTIGYTFDKEVPDELALAWTGGEVTDEHVLKVMQDLGAKAAPIFKDELNPIQ